MTESPIPPVAYRGRAATKPAIIRAAALRGMPTAPLGALPHDDESLYAIARIDDHGRVGDKPLMRALGWSAGQRLDLAPHRGAILVRPAPDGVFRTGRRALVQIPAPLRHWCALVPGDRVLLMATPAQDTLVVHTMATLHAMVRLREASLEGGVLR